MTDPEEVPRYAKWPKKLSASSAERLSACPGSANLPAAIPGWKDGTPKVGNAADKGSFFHEIMEMAGTLSRPEMLNLIKALEYFATLRALRNFKMLIETELTIDFLTEPVSTRPDLVLHTQDEIHVVDWKAGKIFVDVNDNYQLMMYGLCVRPLAPKAKGVWLHVVQPNSKEWEPGLAMVFVTMQQLDQFKQEMIDADQRIANGDLTLVPGDHCTFCPANPHSRGLKGSPLCPEMMAVLYPERQALYDSLVDDFEDDEGVWG